MRKLRPYFIVFSITALILIAGVWINISQHTDFGNDLVVIYNHIMMKLGLPYSILAVKYGIY